MARLPSPFFPLLLPLLCPMSSLALPSPSSSSVLPLPSSVLRRPPLPPLSYVLPSPSSPSLPSSVLPSSSSLVISSFIHVCMPTQSFPFESLAVGWFTPPLLVVVCLCFGCWPRAKAIRGPPQSSDFPYRTCLYTLVCVCVCVCVHTLIFGCGGM